MSFMMPYGMKAVRLSDIIQKPDDLKWNAIRPSGLTCSRAIWYHLHKPHVGDPYSWRDLKGLTEIGKILHDNLVKRFAEEYAKQGYKTELEVEVSGEIEGMPVTGHIDLLITNPINDAKIVVDFKFLNPNAIYKIFFNHIVQVSVYCYLADATCAILHYISRDLLADNIHVISLDDIENGFYHACELIRNAKVSSEDELPPPLNPNDYPCVFVTLKGTAKCPFFKVCHDDWSDNPTQPSPPRDLQEAARRYLELKSQIDELKYAWQPLEAELDDIKKLLKSSMQPQQTIVTDMGRVTMKVVQQKRVDLEAVKRIFEKLNIPLPYANSEMHIIDAEINYE